MSDVAVWLRPALAGLTSRGRSFLAAGAAATGCAIVLGQSDLLRVGLLLIILPVACAVMLGRSRYRLSLVRTVTPARVVAGSTTRVRLELQNLTRLPTRVLLAEDRVPYSLGPSPRFVLARLPGSRRAAVTYSLRSDLRGRYLIGPLRLRLADPFGMCELTRSFTATDPLVVVPPTFPLSSVQAGGTWTGTGESLARNAAASGEDDVATREYRHGDDLRRVHWRSTARRGELMVRRDEQPRQLRATVLLDARDEGHRGEGPASSFEWAVIAAASVGVHLAGERFGVRLVMDEQPSAWTGPYAGDGAGTLLDELAVAQRNGAQSLTGAIGTLARGGGDGLIVAVLGEVEEGEATTLARLGRQGARGIAVLLRTTAWTALPTRPAANLDNRRERVAAILRSGGWLVTDAGPEDKISDVWQRAVGGPTARANRTSLPDARPAVLADAGVATERGAGASRTRAAGRPPGNGTRRTLVLPGAGSGPDLVAVPGPAGATASGSANGAPANGAPANGAPANGAPANGAPANGTGASHEAGEGA